MINHKQQLLLSILIQKKLDIKENEIYYKYLDKKIFTKRGNNLSSQIRKKKTLKR